MDAAKTQKLEEYAAVIEKQAQSVESQGNANEAAKLYVKLIDVYLLLAKEAQDHPTWVKYSTKADALQKKTKELIASASNENTQTGKAGAIKKMLGLKTGDDKNTSQDELRAKPPEQSQSQAKPQNLPRPHIEASFPSEQMVPKRLYDQLLEKNKQLDSQVASMVERSDHESLQSKYKELNEKLSILPSKSDYDELVQRLANSLPRTQYEELQRAFVNVVPKETYNSAKARIAELESQLEDSIPKSILENLANEIALLVVTSAIPIALLPDIEGVSALPLLSGGDHLVSALIAKPNEIQDELLLMRQKIDLLELKLKATSAGNLKN